MECTSSDNEEKAEGGEEEPVQVCLTSEPEMLDGLLKYSRKL